MGYRHKTTKDLEATITSKCEECNEVRPAQTYHCYACGRCCFIYDHHCPWLNNCVGHENRRYFLLFVLYCNLSTGYVLLTLTALKRTGVLQKIIKLSLRLFSP